MLPAVSEEHALSLLEFQENVKKEEGPQSRSSRTSVQQAIIYSLKMLKKPGNTSFSGLFLCLKSPDSDGEI